MNALNASSIKQQNPSLLPATILSKKLPNAPFPFKPSSRVDFCYALESARQKDPKTRANTLPTKGILFNAYYEFFFLTPCHNAGFALSATGELCDLFSLI